MHVLYVHSHISVYQAVYVVYGPFKGTKQCCEQENDDHSRKSPAQHGVQQVQAVCVLVIHHQHLPEVHCLGIEFEKTNCVQVYELKTYSSPVR